MEAFGEGTNILYMKVGTHAQESLVDIIRRKRAEISEAGFAMWGYGGNTCHPTSMVQPFVRASRSPVKLVMQPMISKHFAEPLRATRYSPDGLTWDDIPSAINVLGSRYALCLGDLEEVEEDLDLSQSRVAIGRSSGRPGQEYVNGRVDKACLEMSRAAQGPARIVPIRLTATIVKPYAVFLRN